MPSSGVLKRNADARNKFAWPTTSYFLDSYVCGIFSTLSLHYVLYGIQYTHRVALIYSIHLWVDIIYILRILEVEYSLR